jgi:predicted kinase
VIAGAPATGKSTLGRCLAARLNAALIDQDVATTALVDVVRELVGVNDLDDVRLARLTRSARYETITALAVDNLVAGMPVVLIAPFTSERTGPAMWSQLRTRLEDAGGTPVMAWLSLPPAEILARMRRRSASRDMKKIAQGTEYLRRLSASAQPPSVPHLRLDARLCTPSLAAQVEEALTVAAHPVVADGNSAKAGDS